PRRRSVAPSPASLTPRRDLARAHKTGNLTNDLVLHHGELVCLLPRIRLLENTATGGSPDRLAARACRKSNEVADAAVFHQVVGSRSALEQGERFAASRAFARMPQRNGERHPSVWVDKLLWLRLNSAR